MSVSINDLKIEYKGIDDEFLHDAELLILLFNFPPRVQEKILKDILSIPKVKKILKFSDSYAKKKVALINERGPINRRGVILIENDVMESMYQPRLVKVLADSKEEAMPVALKHLQAEHPRAVIIDHPMIDKLEEAMNHAGRSVDYLVFHKDKIYSYQLELID